jgi:hypothetical protein
LGSYYGLQYYKQLDDEVPVVKIRIVKYSDLGPPPSIGTPIPVPDAEINSEQTIATQTERGKFDIVKKVYFQCPYKPFRTK